jgi:hypothetical protein
MASDYDYLKASDGTGDAALIHVSAVRAVGSTVLTVDSVAAVPTKFIATSGTLLSTGLLDPTTMTNFKGRVTGTTLTIDGFEPGTPDIGNTQGQVVIIKPTTGWANRVAQFIQNATGFGTPEPHTVSTLTASGLITANAGLTIPVGQTIAGAGTLPSNMLFNSCKFNVYWNAGQPSYLATPNQFYKMKFETKRFDTGNNFDTVTNFRFVAPISGFYYLSAVVGINNGTNLTAGYLQPFINNVGQETITVAGTAQTNNINPQWSRLVQLTAGDYVEIFAACGAGGLGVNGLVTSFSGFLVSVT